VENQRHDPTSLLSWMRQLIAVRQRHPVLASGEITFLEPDNHRVLAYLRQLEGEDPILVVANMSQRAQSVELDLRRFLGTTPVEVFGGSPFAPVGEWPYYLTLTPYGFYWFQLTPKRTAGEDDGAYKPPTIEGSWPGVVEGRAPALAPALRRWIQHRRWYAGKSRRIAKLRVEAARLPGSGADSPMRMCTVSIDYVDGEIDSYLVPLTVLDGDRARVLGTFRPEAVVAVLPDGRPIVDAVQDEASVVELVRPMTVRRGARPLTAESQPALRTALDGDEHTVRILSVEQSNSSVVIDDKVMVKLLRRLQNGENLELEVTRHLRDVGYHHGAPLLGSLSWRRADGPDTVALAYGYCPNEGDAWAHVLDQLDLYFQQTPAELGEGTVLGSAAAEITLLGRRTAELHLALAAGDDPAFRPEPATALYQRSLYSSLRGQLRTTLAQLRRQHRAIVPAAVPLAERVLESRDGLLERIDALREAPVGGVRILTHGDYHLGQVLFTGRDFVIIDFEGEPGRPLGERRIKRPPLRDVAGMLRSYDYAVHAALAARQERGLVTAGEEATVRANALRWRDQASASFLAGYAGTDGIDALLPVGTEGRDAFLHAFVLEKALYELRYELDNRPTWVPLPLAALAALGQLPA
jgi:maltose alpha-D-glucosyltransferase/alpha-amylase